MSPAVEKFPERNKGQKITLKAGQTELFEPDGGFVRYWRSRNLFRSLGVSPTGLLRYSYKQSLF